MVGRLVQYQRVGAEQHGQKPEAQRVTRTENTFPVLVFTTMVVLIWVCGWKCLVRVAVLLNRFQKSAGTWTNSPDMLKTYNFCQANINGICYPEYPSGIVTPFYLCKKAQSYNYFITPATTGSVFYASAAANGSYEDGAGLLFSPGNAGLAAGNYDLIIYDENRTPQRLPFTYYGAGSGVAVNAPSTAKFATKVFNSSYVNITFGYANTAMSTVITRVDVVSRNGAASVGTLVTGVVPIPTDQLSKATLAVKTDLAITNRQIGGVRPAYPETGLVWALVENGVIQSLQIYNGSAWESCDGRIWTGERWVPYSSYNIITLQDFYDVADASGGSYEYIYTESGFWAWWQKSCVPPIVVWIEYVILNSAATARGRGCYLL